MDEETNKYYLNRYYNSARNPNTWFSSGEMNKEIAEFLLRKYKSSHKRLVLQAKESIQIHGPTKKRRINPYHLTLHKYILMFFGLSLECHLKGYLIKIKKINPLKITQGKKSLSQDITTHKLKKMYLTAFGTLNTEETHTLERLRRAIEAGKYPIEKSVPWISAYTAYLDKDIKKARKMIRKIKEDA